MKGRLVPINCAAIPESLLESELFGHEKGAFTGAVQARSGKFELAKGGTIFLDEIGEMPLALQAKLLRVLQERTFERVGGVKEIKADVRVIAATNRNLQQEVAGRGFREDLYYRLNAFVIKVPPLRERREEIPYFLNELARRFADVHNLEPVTFSPEMIAAAVQYSWPGNLRELGNFVKRYMVIRDAAAALAELEVKASPRVATWGNVVPMDEAGAGAARGLKSAVRSMKDQTESRMIREVLNESNWNRRIAAERLQISYKALLYKIRAYNLEASA